MSTIAPRQLARWLLLPVLGALAGAQVEQPKSRFMLYNSCEAVGAVVELLPGGAPLSGVSLPQLETMVEGRIDAAGMHAAGARTRLWVGVSRYAVRLEYKKAVRDVASDERAIIATYSRSAVIADGRAATVMLEVSKLLNGFLSNYRRVNLLACGGAGEAGAAAEDDPGPPRLSREPPAPPRGTPSPDGPQVRGQPINFDRWWPVPETEEEKRAKAHRTGAGVTSPRLRSKVEPEYSETARRAGIQGVVKLSAEIWPDGRAHNIRVVRSLGWGLDEKAVESIRQWRFSPGTLDGKPVRVQAQFEVSFRLFKREERP